MENNIEFNPKRFWESCDFEMIFLWTPFLITVMIFINLVHNIWPDIPPVVTGMLSCLRDKKLYPGLNLNDFEHSDSTNWVLSGRLSI